MSKKTNDLALHEKDTGSSEVQIAILTKKIENLSKYPPQQQVQQTVDWKEKPELYMS